LPTWRVDVNLRADGKWRWDRRVPGKMAYDFGVFDSFDESAARKFVELAGQDPHSPTGGALAAQTLAQVRRFQNREFPRSIFSSRYNAEMPGLTYYSRGNNRAFIAAGVLWFLTWWLLARHLRRRYTRAMTAAKASEKATLDALGVEA
jgi:hypothetical protein